MAVTLRTWAMKLGYGSLFVVVLPVFLWSWARASAPSVPLFVHRLPVLGSAVAVGGALLMLWGWIALMKDGGGLPMNAFPPPRYVATGPYRWFAHPIYVGFCGIVLGAALATGSASAQWLVLPTVILGCAALVHGYENPALSARFGTVHRPILSLPDADDARPTARDRLTAYVLVILPWVVIYEGIAALGSPPDARSSLLSFERTWPVLPWTEIAYASVYIGVGAAPLFALRRRDLRRMCLEGWLSMALVFPICLAVPLVSPPRDFAATNALVDRVLVLERQLDTPACAFPSFHVIWALIVAASLASRTRIVWLWAAAAIVSCVTTGMHSVLDVAGGFIAFGMVRRADRLWELLRHAAEAIANSWREWRWGPLRFISHGLWAGAGTVLGLLAMGSVLGSGSAPLLVALWFGGLLGAGLWAQIIEGASGLSRPYGFFGGMAGIVLVALCSPAFGFEPMVTLAACCVGAPFVQSFGRLRCLVQGCCHGAACAPWLGISYRHPRSRVHKVPALFGKPVHPTPLYSILWNIPIALTMGRLATLHAPAHLLGGCYLIVAGAGRFVEEALRGEPQTPIIGPLRLYQWIAIGIFVTGAVLTGWGSGSAISLHALTANVWLVALCCGLGNVLALGVDLPESNRRLSRLA